MKIRREGEGVEKTHMGKVLSGVRLEESDFGDAGERRMPYTVCCVGGLGSKQQQKEFIPHKRRTP